MWIWILEFLNLEFGIRDLEFGIWNLEFGIWNLEFAICNLEFWILEFGNLKCYQPLFDDSSPQRNSTLGFWNLEFGIWNLEFGIWNLKLGIWNLEFGIWNLEFGIWNLEFEIRNLEFWNATNPCLTTAPLARARGKHTNHQWKHKNGTKTKQTKTKN